MQIVGFDRHNPLHVGFLVVVVIACLNLFWGGVRVFRNRTYRQMDMGPGKRALVGLLFLALGAAGIAFAVSAWNAS